MPEPTEPQDEAAVDDLTGDELRESDDATDTPPRGSGRRALAIGTRIAAGVVGVAAALATVAAVGLVPIPHVGAAPDGILVEPAPPAQTRVCPGPLLRLGDEAGGDAGTPIGIGTPRVTAGAEGGELDRAALGDPGSRGGGAPETLHVPPAEDTLLAGAQAQTAATRDVTGLSASACLEPGGSAWLLGGATTVGRTALLSLANPGEVAATVSLRLLGENGAVSAPGMSGIDVPPGSRRVVSLAGYAPDLASPVVEVTARGGRIAATLQHTLVRGIDPGGSEIVAPAADPATELVIPGVRVVGSARVGEAFSLPDWHDVIAAIRIGVPGNEPASVTVTVTPESGDPAAASTFTLEVSPASTTDIPLSAGLDAESMSFLPDGTYTVRVDADHPVVAAVRVSTAAEADTEVSPDGIVVGAPASDVAWFVAAPPLVDGTPVAIAGGPRPELVLVNSGEEPVAVELTALTGSARSVEVPAEGAARIPVQAGSVYRLDGAEGLAAAVSFTAPGRLASYPVIPPRPLAAPLLVHP